MSSLEAEKQALREAIWSRLEELGVAAFPLPCRGRVPNFLGSDLAAERVRGLPEWRRADVILANPDYAQRRIREHALLGGKALIMASPRLRRGYLAIDPKTVKGLEAVASAIGGAFKFGKPIKALPKPDLVVTGCVAVDGCFYRLGKGGGYGDREIATVQRLFGQVPVLTTVHEAQLVERVPREPHDTRVDIVVTPLRVLRRKS